jgi:hypothetical protein
MPTQGFGLRVKEPYIETSPCRADIELWTLMSRPSNWTINGPKGVVFDRAKTLKSAVSMALSREAEGWDIVAVVRNVPGMHRVVVLMNQVRRIAGSPKSQQADTLQNGFEMAAETFGSRQHLS